MEHPSNTTPHNGESQHDDTPVSPQQRAYQEYIQKNRKEKSERPPQKPERKEGFWAEIIRFSVIALIVVIPIRIFIAQPFIVTGASMDPTFHDGQYLIVDQVTYRFEEPERGEVIIFRFPRDPSKFFIKRIIAKPGETIEINGNTVIIKNEAYPEGFELNEFYVPEMEPDTELTETLGEREYFVMGDNRDASHDSRMWGVLPEDLIVGRAILRLLPADEIDLFPGSASPKSIEITQ